MILNVDIIKKLYVPNDQMMEYHKKTGFNYVSLRERHCWNCKKELDFWDYISQNTKNDFEYLLEVWESPHVELYCCKCYNQELKEKFKPITKFTCRGRFVCY